MNKYLKKFLPYMYMFIEKKPTPAVYLSYIKIQFTGYFKKADPPLGLCFS